MAVVITGGMEETWRIVEEAYDYDDVTRFVLDNNLKLSQDEFDILFKRYRKTKYDGFEDDLWCIVEDEFGIKRN